MDTTKIIIGKVGGGRYTVTSPIVKEDYGLYLLIEGLELPSTYEVDFSNSEHNGTSVTMIGNSDGVLIPSQFISSGKDVFAFLYHVGADFGRTVYKFRIPNKLRPDRTNEQPTPEEQSTIDQAISALNSAVAQTAQDVIDADASAQSASESAESAEASAMASRGWAESAEDYAQSAEQSELQASASATASANSASQSAQIKDDVEGMVDDAQASASASAQSASASANSASQASGYAQSASASAQSASGYASSAQTSAQTASAKASEASTSASTASQKATEASQSASQALSYKTDAESAKTASQTAQGLAESARDSAVQAKTDAESAKADAESARDEAQQAVASISGALAEKAPVITDTASGAIASFTDGADNLPLKSLVVDIDPVQDLHGYDSPWVAGGGKNKIKFPYGSGSSLTVNGVTFTVDSTGVITVNGTASANAEFVLSPQNSIVNLPAGDWTLSGLPSGGSSSSFVFNIYAHDPDGATLFDRRTGAESFTFSSATAIKDIYLGLRIISGYTCNNLKVYPQFESGSTKTAFAPYKNICPISGWTEVNVNHSDADTTNPTTITINLGQTVYGGKLDVLSGVLTVDRAMVDLGTLSWNLSFSSTNIWQTEISNKKTVTVPPYTNRLTGIICSMYGADSQVAISQEAMTDKKWICSFKSVYIKDTAYSSATAFKAAMSGVQLVYELATLLEIQLTPNQVNSLLGVNNIWADSGDTEVVYRADTKKFIERLTAPDSADMIADSNITSGQYFMVGDSLYKATANIASGSAVIVGTNCTRKSLSEALNEINA